MFLRPAEQGESQETHERRAEEAQTREATEGPKPEVGGHVGEHAPKEGLPKDAKAEKGHRLQFQHVNARDLCICVRSSLDEICFFLF